MLQHYYNEQQPSFWELIEKHGSVAIHVKIIESLAIEIFSVSGNLSLPVTNDIFKQKDNDRYNFGQISEFSRPLVKQAYHGSKSITSVIM